ncbi:hypothetical protein BJ980_003104 [Nocardioides daedukensis]|uniref:Trypsin-like serine protease n=1 Tax=Nocardioides daedukensis TaxID=634462 RepID=A0A7Y9S2N0_9ACTN|nr:hypothetical protein [Nocardioides daedukensis]
MVAPDASKSTSDRRAQLQHAALVPVLSIKEVTLGDHASVKNFSRGNDSPPWYAGGMRGSNCTLGFAVKTATDEVRLMTANHCGGAVGGNVRDGSGDLIGTLTVRNSEWDAQLIRPTNYSVLTGYGRVFHGNWYTTSSRAVIGSTYPIVNDYLCVSGAFSGTHCSLRVTSTNFSGPSGQAGDGPRLVVTAAPGEYAGCSGDSGGPIIDPSGTASSHAAGMVIGPADPSINELVTSNVRGGGAVCNRQITFFRHTAVAGHFNVNTITH